MLFRSHLPPQPNPHSGVRGALRASPPRVRSLAAFGRRPPVDAARLSLAGIRNPAHVWTAPGWQGFSSRVQQWSEQPCVRPVSAVHVTAGHNALRGSGPGQMHAFDDALARVGCPDRQIYRLCITCCLPFPTVHITPDARRDLSRRECDGFFVALASDHHCPHHSGNLVGERDGGNLGRTPRQQGGKPGSKIGRASCRERV